MQRSDLAASVLQLKALGIDNVVKFEFPSAPPSKNLISCLELLYALGAIDDGGSLTRDTIQCCGGSLQAFSMFAPSMYLAWSGTYRGGIIHDVKGSV